MFVDTPEISYYKERKKYMY